MQLYTKKLLWPHILWQPLLAIIFVAALLYTLRGANMGSLTWAVGAGAMSSSVCLVFGTPSLRSARVQNILGGYAIAMICGLLVQFCTIHVSHICLDYWRCQTALHSFVFAAVVGLVLIVMSCFHCQHPPAAGLALVIALDIGHYAVLIVIAVAAIVLAALKILLRSYLRDLVD